MIHNQRDAVRLMTQTMFEEITSFNGTFGFLPKNPLTKLPDQMYEPWEDIVNNLNGLILSSTLRSRILKVN
jgi:hypothetical protein